MTHNEIKKVHKRLRWLFDVLQIKSTLWNRRRYARWFPTLWSYAIFLTKVKFLFFIRRDPDYSR